MRAEPIHIINGRIEFGGQTLDIAVITKIGNPDKWGQKRISGFCMINGIRRPWTCPNQSASGRILFSGLNP